MLLSGETYGLFRHSYVKMGIVAMMGMGNHGRAAKAPQKHHWNKRGRQNSTHPARPNKAVKRAAARFGQAVRHALEGISLGKTRP